MKSPEHYEKLALRELEHEQNATLVVAAERERAVLRAQVYATLAQAAAVRAETLLTHDDG